MIIKYRPGDVIEPGGGICSVPGELVWSGVVIIHRSRLRRAKRFGWVEAPHHIVDPAEVAEKLVAVCRA